MMLEKVAIVCYKVKKGQEMNTAETVAKRAELHGYDIRTILVTEIQGYIFFEGDVEDIAQAVDTAQYVGKMLGRVSVAEIENNLLPAPVIDGLKKGDIVEIIDGPFKGSTARITSIYHSREEITVDLMTSSVTIPIVLHADTVKLIHPSQEEEEEELSL